MSFFKRLTKSAGTINDEALLADYRQDGDLKVLGSLFERYAAMVYGICLKYLSDEDKSKDAVMGIFEELIVKARQHNVTQFKPWLYTLSRNFCLMQLRKEKKLDVIPLDGIMETAAFLHLIDNEQEETVQILQRCMEKLPATQKQSINLFFIDQKCYKEITAITGFSMNEVKSYIQNGKRNLKICMEKYSEQ